MIKLVVILHFIVVFTNIIAFFVLPFTSLILDIPFWYSVFLVTPIESFILSVTFSREPCPLTRLENKMREKRGLPKIGGFIGHYLLRKRRA